MPIPYFNPPLGMVLVDGYEKKTLVFDYPLRSPRSGVEEVGKFLLHSKCICKRGIPTRIPDTSNIPEECKGCTALEALVGKKVAAVTCIFVDNINAKLPHPLAQDNLGTAEEYDAKQFTRHY